MKKKLLLLLFISNLLYSKSLFDEITLKNGSKTQIKSQSFKVDLENKSISYIPENSEKTIKVNFKDFSWAEFGVNKFEIFKFQNEELEGYFVLAENEKYKLITQKIFSEDEHLKKYEFLITDHNNAIIEQHIFDNKKNQKSSYLRSEIYGKIKFYFSENLTLLKRLETFDKNSSEVDNTLIIGFFNNPIYFKTK